MEKVLEINNLIKVYHTKDEEIKALDNISFYVNENELISIVGPSGCGKSTILSILSKLVPKTEGNIYLKDNFTIAYMLQDDCLLPFKTILENCLIGLEITNNLNEENIKYVKYLLDKYGLSSFMNKYPSSLSGGMRQRCALIRTLATKPDILLLDEATSALDYQTSLVISEDIYRIIKSEGKTAIIVTHDIGLAVSISDRVIVLSKRPAKIKNIYPIVYSNKSSPIENRKSKEFMEYYDLIWRDLDVHI